MEKRKAPAKKSSATKAPETVVHANLSREPVNIAIPSTTKEKMAAISSLSIAVMEISKALNSTQVNVVVSHNVIGNGLRVVDEDTDEPYVNIDPRRQN